MPLQLPLETWAEVFRNLDRPDWIRLRQVCRAFGTIGAKSLFSSLRIYLFDTRGGIEELLLREDSDMMYEYDEVVSEQANRLSVRSWETLNHITRNPDFAVLVHTLIVYAMYRFPLTFEHLCLVNAIRKLPGLATFHWLASQVPIPDIVTQSLPDDLTSFCLHGTPEIDAFGHLRHLREVVIALYPDGEDHPNFQNLIANNADSLRVLSLPSNLCAKLPVRLFDNLTHFHVRIDPGFSESAGGFEFALCHVTNIESLSLLLNAPGYEIEAIDALLDNSDAFINLVSLQLCFSSDFSYWRARCSDLFSFIRERRKLRRLYLAFFDLIIGPHCQEVYSSIRELPDLQVLGLEPCQLAYPYDDPSDYLLDFLPQKLRGFHAKLPRGDVFGEESANLLNKIGRFKNLTYFSLSNDNLSPLNFAAFAADKPLLRFIGHNEELFDVRIDKLMSIRWPKWKTAYTIQEDFGDEDEWWLHNAVCESARRYNDEFYDG